MVFTLIVTKDTLLASNALMDVLESCLTSTSVSFVKLSEMGILLADVLSTAESLVQQRRAMPEVNRHGHFAGIRLSGKGARNEIKQRNT